MARMNFIKDTVVISGLPMPDGTKVSMSAKGANAIKIIMECWHACRLAMKRSDCHVLWNGLRI